MEDITYSELVSRNYEAGKALIEAESNDNPRRALKIKTRVTASNVYNLGDLVYH